MPLEKAHALRDLAPILPPKIKNYVYHKTQKRTTARRVTPGIRLHCTSCQPALWAPTAVAAAARRAQKNCKDLKCLSNTFGSCCKKCFVTFVVCFSKSWTTFLPHVTFSHENVTFGKNVYQMLHLVKWLPDFLVFYLIFKSAFVSKAQEFSKNLRNCAEMLTNLSKIFVLFEKSIEKMSWHVLLTSSEQIQTF